MCPVQNVTYVSGRSTPRRSTLTSLPSGILKPGKAFGWVRPEEVGGYRADLIKRGHNGLLRSTANHRTAHLKAFFKWLLEQEGYRRMDKTLAGYFILGHVDVEEGKFASTRPRCA